jgi:putative heme-binding domain-containing protein
VLEPWGATFRSADSDFVSSDHHDFHPTDVIEDADGSLLVIDTGGWYKLCCPTSQLYKPDVLGAIYRVRRQDAAPVDDPRGLRLDWDADLTGLLGDARPAVARRAVQSLRKRGAVAPLARVLASSGSAQMRRNAVWTLAGISSREAGEALRGALRQSDSSTRHAAIHALSVHSNPVAARDLERVLRGDSNLPARRAAAEALGRLGDKESVKPILAEVAKLSAETGGMLPDRVLEHSYIFALIEINAPDQLQGALADSNDFVRRAALIALDQINNGALRARDVAGLLDSKSPVLKHTANWILEHRRDWAGELAGILGERLRMTELSAGDERELETHLANFANGAAIRELLGAAVADDRLLVPRRRLALRAMRLVRGKEAPVAWAESVAAVIVNRNRELAEEALETGVSLAFKNRPDKLKSALRTAVSNRAFPVEVRLRALAVISADEPLERPEFQLALASMTAPYPASVAATTVLAKAKLGREQLLELCERLREAGPIELNAVLTAFENAPSEHVGERLIASLKEARGLGGLNMDRARQLFAKYPETVRDRAREIYLLLNEDGAKQASRIEELLPALKDGDVRRGQAIFKSERAACSACHAIGYLGGDLGPDLTRIGQVRNERDLLEAIVYPSASFARSFEPMIVRTSDGEEYSGLLRRDAAEELVLATGPGVEIRIVRGEVAELRPGKLSIMPQGLDEQLSRQELADLLAFLKSTRW